MTVFGIDVSHHNKVADWHAVHGNNITYASVKLSESTGFTDPAAGGHVSGARGVGIHVGGYHFARNAAVEAQVDRFVAGLRAHDLLRADSLAPMLDIESTDLFAHANTFIPDFVQRLRKQTGVHRVLVYASLDTWQRFLRPNEWADQHVALWVARYNGDPGKPGWVHPKLVLHQHTDKGNVPGIPAHVDRDATVGGHTLADILTAN